ncbi:D-alanyl-D-alanine carboxypeptidase [Candidatus Peregrinibacteria bacterium]|nr:MAG: D-alanyl-D-alanine carboxypeptidase [Candidatus Peregrinibacteria bacterium]
MLRSLLSILLLAQLNVATAPSTNPPTPWFNMSDMIMASAIPMLKPNAEKPQIGAKSALLVDAETGMPLLEKSSQEPLPMASLTKIMTALLIVESHDLNEVVTVKTAYPGEQELGVRMWLVKNETITVESLLTGLLVRSAGDAAMALAEFHSGSPQAFIQEMNDRAKSLGLKNTQFKNTIGLDEPGHYASAYDLAILTRHALKNPDFRRLVQIKQATVTSTNGALSHTFQTTNQLLDSLTLDIRGVKTGTTDAAGNCVINLAHLKNNKEILVILLNSPDRFGESERLIQWAQNNVIW